MRRVVIPELLDHLPASDPRAIHSRGDLRRINTLMGNADIIGRELLSPGLSGSRMTIVEIGGGDGTFLLEVAKRAAPAIGPVRALLIDQQSIVTMETTAQLAKLSWHLETVKADVFQWLHDFNQTADVTIANLFLHHFEDDRLQELLSLAAARTRTFLACEPLRSPLAYVAASLMGVIGCNSVTVHDGRISIRAGFCNGDLSTLWPRSNAWSLVERRAGRFTHGFRAEHV